MADAAHPCFCDCADIRPCAEGWFEFFLGAIFGFCGISGRADVAGFYVLLRRAVSCAFDIAGMDAHSKESVSPFGMGHFGVCGVVQDRRVDCGVCNLAVVCCLRIESRMRESWQSRVA